MRNHMNWLAVADAPALHRTSINATAPIRAKMPPMASSATLLT
jgi:hypothetical protein